MNFIRDLWAFLKTRKKVWLMPVIIVMILLGALLIYAAGSALAPVIYTLF